MDTYIHISDVTPVRNASFHGFKMRLDGNASNVSSSPLLCETEFILIKSRHTRRLSVDQLFDMKQHLAKIEATRQTGSAITLSMPSRCSTTPENDVSSSSSSPKNILDDSDFQKGYIRFDESPSPLRTEPRFETHKSCRALEDVKPPSSFAQISALHRRKFAEQFHDLSSSSSLHNQSTMVSWDAASRLFPTQFAISPSVALNIWKQVDTDGDLMLNESEYCLATHLAEKFAETGFSILDQATSSFPDVDAELVLPSSLPQYPPPIPSFSSSSVEQPIRRQRHLVSQSLLDDSFDYLLSPISTSITVTPDLSGFPCRCYRSSHSSSRSNSSQQPLKLAVASDPETTYDDEEDEAEEQEGANEVAALLPGSVLIASPNISLRNCSRSSSSASSSNSLSVSSSSLSSSSSSVLSRSKSSPSMYNASSVNFDLVSCGEIKEMVPDSFCFDSMHIDCEIVDPLDVLSSVTGRSRLSLYESLTKHRRRRLLENLVREAKSTNYTLLRLNNELAGELQELRDQQTNLDVQVRHHMSLFQTPLERFSPPPQPPARRPIR